ncbi:MAG: AmmeMemoRadiSam system protein B [Bacteroidales bacterium]|nr:AmmeMemoRadiSam system protein B [Bacteroidales bacterium]
MITNKAKLLSLLLIFLFAVNCSSQHQKKQDQKQDNTSRILINRKATAAGRFYTSNPVELRSTLKKLFADAIPKKTNNVVAIISPHAGYAFSGEVAASAYNQIDKEKNYENIFIIASSHCTSFYGASIYSLGNYETPLGDVSVNIPLAIKLKQENDVFTYNTEAHKNEHSLENQLPLLQYIMETKFHIIPIVIGSQSADVSEKIAEALKPYFNENNLFIISSDFSHYPKYEDANVVDKNTADAICRNSPDYLIETLRKNEEHNIRNLATSLCGWTSVLSLLYMTSDNPDVEIIPVQYKNSGDVAIGDKDKVVGYYSIVVTKKNKDEGLETGFFLNNNEKIKLLEIARETITTYLLDKKTPFVAENELSDNLLLHCGAFVTLNKDHRLRGCIGRFTADIALYKVIQEMSIAAATQDRRFPNVSTKEIEMLEIEISVLTPLKKIESIDEIEMGKHGIYIKKGYASGTFLPQVATETGWSKEEFLGHCARDKAGLGWDGWREADIYIYEAVVFSEHEFSEGK